MSPEDDDLLRVLAEEERAKEEADRARRARLQRRIGAVIGGLAVLGIGGCALWGYVESGQRAQAITILGREDVAVRVEIEGEQPEVIPARGGVTLRPSRPGPRRFRFIEVESGRAFERVLDLPQNERGSEIRLAVPTAEDSCFVMVDMDAWYGEAQSLLEIAAERRAARERSAEEAAPEPGPPHPRPRLHSRIRPLDPLPISNYTRNLYVRRQIGVDDGPAMSLVDVPCADLALSDDVLIDQILERFPPDRL